MVELESFRRDSQRLSFCLSAWISVECAWYAHVQYETPLDGYSVDSPQFLNGPMDLDSWYSGEMNFIFCSGEELLCRVLSNGGINLFSRFS